MLRIVTISNNRNRNYSYIYILYVISDSTFETVANQEEAIKANRDILEQLYAEIAELEERKSKYDEDKNYLDKNSESSPDILSEIDAKAHLENELVQKNRHIRKLLGYNKVVS